MTEWYNDIINDRMTEWVMTKWQNDDKDMIGWEEMPEWQNDIMT